MKKENPEFESIMASALLKCLQKAIDECGDHEIFIQIMNNDKTATISKIDTVDMREGGYDKDTLKELFVISNSFEMIGEADYEST